MWLTHGRIIHTKYLILSPEAAVKRALSMESLLRLGLLAFHGEQKAPQVKGLEGRQRSRWDSPAVACGDPRWSRGKRAARYRGNQQAARLEPTHPHGRRFSRPNGGVPLSTSKAVRARSAWSLAITNSVGFRLSPLSSVPSGNSPGNTPAQGGHQPAGPSTLAKLTLNHGGPLPRRSLTAGNARESVRPCDALAVPDRHRGSGETSASGRSRPR